MILRIIINVFLVLGAFFALAGTVGVLRMKDSYCRIQSAANITTLGLLLALIGGLLYAIFLLHNWPAAVKIGAIGVFSILGSPVSSHALARAAYRSGVRPDEEMVCDHMKEGES